MRIGYWLLSRRDFDFLSRQIPCCDWVIDPGEQEFISSLTSYELRVTKFRTTFVGTQWAECIETGAYSRGKNSPFHGTQSAAKSFRYSYRQINFSGYESLNYTSHFYPENIVNKEGLFTYRMLTNSISGFFTISTSFVPSFLDLFRKKKGNLYFGNDVSIFFIIVLLLLLLSCIVYRGLYAGHPCCYNINLIPLVWLH